ncbi:MAG: ribosome maturation factor RimP [Gemmatimonadota bacterium]|nr:ribosome maturation factor RimP [Gemmatimonadota bacterium]MDH5804232.1 ribosome maturation factor RimP [Gemmatimonadota bacterium]
MENIVRDLTETIRAKVLEAGFELVDFRRKGSAARPILQVRIDHADSAPGRGITHDHCALVSRALEAWLDEEKILGERYVLEVSSAGVERPIRWPEHWRRFRGAEVHVRLPGFGRVRAEIGAVAEDGSTVTLHPKGEAEPVTVVISNIHDATLAVDWD